MRFNFVERCSVVRMNRMLKKARNRIVKLRMYNDDLENEADAAKEKAVEMGRLYVEQMLRAEVMERRVVELKRERDQLQINLNKATEICKELGI